MFKRKRATSKMNRSMSRWKKLVMSTKKNLPWKSFKLKSLNKKLKKRVFTCMMTRLRENKTWPLKIKKKLRRKVRNSRSKMRPSKMMKWTRVNLFIKRKARRKLVKESRMKKAKEKFKEKKSSSQSF